MALTLVAAWVLYVSVNVLFPSQGEVRADRDAVVSLAPQPERVKSNGTCHAISSWLVWVRFAGSLMVACQVISVGWVGG